MALGRHCRTPIPVFTGLRYTGVREEEVTLPITPQYRPVFAYGTLRPGCGNYRRLLAAHVINEQPAVARGHALYTHGPFPYAVLQEGASVVGYLLTIDPAVYTQVLRWLDQLEGYRPDDPDHSHYLRVDLTVEVPVMGFAAKLVGAWIYRTGPTVDISTMRSVTGGDWLAHGTG